MRRLALILALVSAPALADTVEQCRTLHFKLAKQYPDISYEKDPNIVTIWCKCMAEQTKQGRTLDRAVEHCATATNEPINRYLQSK